MRPEENDSTASSAAFRTMSSETSPMRDVAPSTAVATAADVVEGQAPPADADGNDAAAEEGAADGDTGNDAGEDDESDKDAGEVDVGLGEEDTTQLPSIPRRASTSDTESREGSAAPKPKKKCVDTAD